MSPEPTHEPIEQNLSIPVAAVGANNDSDSEDDDAATAGYMPLSQVPMDSDPMFDDDDDDVRRRMDIGAGRSESRDGRCGRRRISGPFVGRGSDLRLWLRRFEHRSGLGQDKSSQIHDGHFHAAQNGDTRMGQFDIGGSVEGTHRSHKIYAEQRNVRILERFVFWPSKKCIRFHGVTYFCRLSRSISVFFLFSSIGLCIFALYHLDCLLKILKFLGRS